MDWILNFTAGLALISLAVMGFIIVAIIFMRWLENNTTYSFEQLSNAAERDIDRLRDEAIGDMFDVARASRVQRKVAVDGDDPQ